VIGRGAEKALLSDKGSGSTAY